MAVYPASNRPSKGDTDVNKIYSIMKFRVHLLPTPNWEQSVLQSLEEHSSTTSPTQMGLLLCPMKVHLLTPVLVTVHLPVDLVEPEEDHQEEDHQEVDHQEADPQDEDTRDKAPPQLDATITTLILTAVTPELPREQAIQTTVF